MNKKILIRRLFLGLLLFSSSCQIMTEMLSDKPHLEGLILFAFGLFLMFSSFSNYKDRTWVSSAIAIFLLMLLPGIIEFLARYREIPGLASLLAFVLDISGIPSSSENGRIFMNIAYLTIEYLPSLSRIGGFTIILIFSGFCILFGLVPIQDSWKRFGHIATVLIGYAMIRILVLLCFRVVLPVNGFEISERINLISFLPAALLLRRDLIVLEDTQFNGSNRRVLLGKTILAIIVAFSFTLSLGWIDPGKSKQGRILFDDSHGKWEPTDTPFDTKVFTQQVSYAYSSLYKLLGWYYPVERLKNGPITPDKLREIDTLIVKTPTRAFSDGEVSTINEFVKKGGGLFVIGDHTNLFGMTTYLNKLTRTFGLEFEKDDTFHLITESATIWESPLWLAHPIARMTKRFEFETSCSIKAHLGACAPIIGYSMGSELADYSKPGFFGNLHLDFSDDYGFFIQHAVDYYGKGRIALFSDSTPLSNFSLFFPSRTEIVLSTLAFLNKENTFMQHFPMIFFYSFVFTLVFLFIYYKGFYTKGIVLGLIIGLVIGSAVVFGIGKTINYPLPKSDVPKVVFDRSVSDYILPHTLSLENADDIRSMDTFLIAAQRLDTYPRVSENLMDSLKKRDTLLMVMIYPKRFLEEQETKALMGFVRRGGRLLFLESLTQNSRYTNSILQYFGMSVEITTIIEDIKGEDLEKEEEVKNKDIEYAHLRPVLRVRGGNSIIKDSYGNTIYGENVIGKGKVGVMVDSVSFSKMALGSRFSGTASKEKLKAHNTAFYILKRLLN